MKRIICFLMLPAVVSVQGFSFDIGSWDHQAQVCTPEPGTTCDADLGTSCREDAWHTYFHNYDECGDLLTSQARQICRANATSVYSAIIGSCPPL